MNVLAADIGGTNSRFVLVSVHEDGSLQLRQAPTTYPSAELDGAIAGARRFLEADPARTVDAVCMAVAGPVRAGVARLTNLGWEVREDALAAELSVDHTHVMNDFEALGHAIPHLSGGDLYLVHAGAPDPHAPKVVLGAGTGLGQALVIPRSSGAGVRAFATEGGHATFAPRSDAEWALRRYLSPRHGHVSWERILSGDGLHALYRHLLEREGRPPDDGTRAAMAERDPAAVVTERGLAGTDGTCAAALDLFIRLYGARAGDMALSAGALGGIYLAGGIAPRMPDRFRSTHFREAFFGKGRMTGWLKRVPVHLVVREDAALIGAVAGRPWI